MKNINLEAIANIVVSRLANLGINVEASAETLVTSISVADLKVMDKSTRYDLYAYALDRADDAAWWGVCGLVGRYIDNEYYNDNIDAFREYESHMGEPNFDWDFYSDWHKDMYGYRPR